MTKFVKIVTGLGNSVMTVNSLLALDVDVAANSNGIGMNAGAIDKVGTSSGIVTGRAAAAEPQRAKPLPTNNNPTQKTKAISIASLKDILGATILTADRQIVGTVKNVRPAAIGKFVATIQMNSTLGADAPMLQLTMQMPTDRTDRIRIGFTKRALLARIGS